MLFTNLTCDQNTNSHTEELNATAEKSRINDPALSQPACTALQVALVDLLSSWGVKPSVVVGHSSGEIAVRIILPSICRNITNVHIGCLCKASH